jgi:hypothetical protein
MTTLVLRGQCQVCQGFHRPVRAQHRLGQLEERISAPGKAGVEISPETRQHRRRLRPFGTWICHTGHKAVVFSSRLHTHEH